MKRLIIIVCVALIPQLLIAATQTAETPAVNYPYSTGFEEVDRPAVFPPYPSYNNQDLIGSAEAIGTTWYELQHNGTIGRMAAKDLQNYLHFAWTNGVDYGAVNRHIYYNYVTPSGTQSWPGTGYPLTSFRSGYCTLDVDGEGRAYIAFHCSYFPGGTYTTVVGRDYLPQVGTFTLYFPPELPDVPEVIWPRMQLDRRDRLHIVSTENPESGIAGEPQRHFYIGGSYDPTALSVIYGSWDEMTWTMTIATDMATSEVSDRVAFGWTYCRDDWFPLPGQSYSQRNNDLYLLIDEDGVDPDWNLAFNLTDFVPPDLSWLPDTTMANRDTFRVYTDMSLFFDQDDYLHAAFTTPSYFAIEGTRYWHASIIWHWSEQYPDEFHMIHNAFDDWWWNFIDCGAWNVKAQRPSLGQDPSTGYLYCSYQVYDCDTLAQSAGGWPSGEVYVSVSTDGGQSWAVGTNVTETVTPNNAAPGQCLSEICPTIAKVVDGECHIQYVLDRDAGIVVHTEGTWTLNDVIYHKVPVDSIPTTPLVPDTIFLHVPGG